MITRSPRPRDQRADACDEMCGANERENGPEREIIKHGRHSGSGRRGAKLGKRKTAKRLDGLDPIGEVRDPGFCADVLQNGAKRARGRMRTRMPRITRPRTRSRTLALPKSWPWPSALQVVKPVSGGSAFSISSTMQILRSRRIDERQLANGLVHDRLRVST